MTALPLSDAERECVDRFFATVSDEDLEQLIVHLRGRFASPTAKSGLNVVFDVTRWCDLACRGCCTSARVFRDAERIPEEKLEISTEKVFTILRMFRQYLDTHPGKPFYVNYGGGEPFLRGDFPEILRTSAELFGRDSVATDTNGTLITLDTALGVVNYISYLGVSIDGLEEHHNRWRNPAPGVNGFRRTVDFIKACLSDPELRSVVEVSTVVSRGNLKEIPVLVRFLADLGLKQYSVHRTMPVGRYISIQDQIPLAEEYLWLAVELAKLRKQLDMEIHFHHSLESIYGALLLGINTHAGDDVLGNPDTKSSLGVDPQGNLYFDPWCTEPPWSQLNAGSLLSGQVSLVDILDGAKAGVLTLAKAYCKKDIRCMGCKVACSGGSRIAAAATVLGSGRQATLSHLLSGLAAIDPACPLSLLRKRSGTG